MAIIFTTPTKVFTASDVPAGKGRATTIGMTVEAPAGTTLSVILGATFNAHIEVLGWILPINDFHGGLEVTLPGGFPLGIPVQLVVRAKTDLLFLPPPSFSTKLTVHGRLGADANNSDELEVKGNIVSAELHNAALDLALDKSQFTDATTIARTKLACLRLLDFMTDADWLGVSTFTSSVGRRVDLNRLTSQHRADAIAAINALKRSATGNCAISHVAGTIIDGLNDLPNICDCAPDGRALLLVSMGIENVITPVPPPSPAKRFGVSLSPVPGIISSITPGHVFILGDASNPNEMFRLEKFLLQSLAEMANLAPIFDPVGTLSGPAPVKIPFDVADTESNVRVLVLVDDPSLVRLDLEIGGRSIPVLDFPGAGVRRGTGSIEFSLDRTVLEQAAIGEEPCKPHKRDHRATPQVKGQMVPPPALSSTWNAVLSLSKDALAQGSRLEPVPYTLLVFAESDLRFGANVYVDSECIGGTAFLSAWLKEYEAPVSGKRVQVWAEVTYPDGGSGTIELSETVAGRFAAELRCTQPGAYRYRIFASGKTFRGKRFKRELTRSSYTYPGARRDCLPCVDPRNHLPPKPAATRGRDDEDHEDDDEIQEEPTRRPTDKSAQLGLAMGKVLEALRLARDAFR